MACKAGYILVKRPMQCIIITIGDELLIGQTIDTNSAWMAQQLNLLGIAVTRRIAIADERNAIINALNETVGKTDLVLLTGGLGPTADDITKPVLCGYFGGKLVVNLEVQEHVRKIFSKSDRPILQRNLAQAEVPDVCTVLFNRVGTAPGMWFENDGTIVVAMPGVPFEMQAIMEDEVLPRISKAFITNNILHKTLITAGMGESYIAEQIAAIEQSLPAHISLAYLPSPGMVKLRLTAQGNNRSELESEIEIFAVQIKQRLGIIVAADEDISMEQIIVNLLKQHQRTVTFAESCTGGYLAHRLTLVPGASEVFNGSMVTYANAIKQRYLHVPDTVLQTDGAVSEATVLQMATQARIMFEADIAIAVSGILGPGGGTDEKPVGLVWIGLATTLHAYARKFLFRHDRVRNKELIFQAAYDMLRKELLAENGVEG